MTLGLLPSGHSTGGIAGGLPQLLAQADCSGSFWGDSFPVPPMVSSSVALGWDPGIWMFLKSPRWFYSSAGFRNYFLRFISKPFPFRMKGKASNNNSNNKNRYDFYLRIPIQWTSWRSPRGKKSIQHIPLPWPSKWVKMVTIWLKWIKFCFYGIGAAWWMKMRDFSFYLKY